MKPLALVALTLLLSGCGSGSSSTANQIVTPPVVHAAGFTNANLIGGYGFGVSGTAGSFAFAGSGVIVADGTGNLTSGEETDNNGGIMCHSTLTGSYSVNANGTGSALVNVTPDTASVGRGCVPGVAQLSLAIANNGASLILASQGPNSVTVVTALRQ